ncbi:hypothetical protein B0H10DRAFT_2224591 [Mycena sp. CBHHK59/15]|nr:hypothetical protein B0H10DRAFT_2224591 [Mycena sp. CBHHK59/15]
MSVIGYHFASSQRARTRAANGRRRREEARVPRCSSAFSSTSFSLETSGAVELNEKTVDVGMNCRLKRLVETVTVGEGGMGGAAPAVSACHAAQVNDCSLALTELPAPQSTLGTPTNISPSRARSLLHFRLPFRPQPHPLPPTRPPLNPRLCQGMHHCRTGAQPVKELDDPASSTHHRTTYSRTPEENENVL